MVENNQMVTFKDLQDMIDNEGFNQNKPFSPRNELANKIQVIYAIFINNAVFVSSVLTSWSGATDDHGIAFYDLYLVTDVPFFIERVNSDISQYVFTGLYSNLNYGFLVRTIDSIGQVSPPSNIAEGKTLPLPFIIHENLSNTTTTVISVFWNGGSIPVTSYTLRYRKVGDSTWIEIIGLVNTSWTVPGLTSGTSYEFQVIPFYTSNTGAWSNLIRTSTIVSNPDTEKPTAPTSFTLLDSTEDTVTARWIGATDNIGVVGYNVYLNNNGNDENFIKYEFQSQNQNRNFLNQCSKSKILCPACEYEIKIMEES